MKATKEEQNAINTLKRLEKRWPKTIWLFATGEAIHVFRCGENNEHVMSNTGAPDINYELAYLTKINNDGGDF